MYSGLWCGEGVPPPPTTATRQGPRRPLGNAGLDGQGYGDRGRGSGPGAGGGAGGKHPSAGEIGRGAVVATQTHQLQEPWAIVQ